jgi:hypothetical protein
MGQHVQSRRALAENMRTFQMGKRERGVASRFGLAGGREFELYVRFDAMVEGGHGCFGKKRPLVVSCPFALSRSKGSLEAEKNLGALRRAQGERIRNEDFRLLLLIPAPTCGCSYRLTGLAIIRHADAGHVDCACDDGRYWQRQPCSPESQSQLPPQAQAIGTASTGVAQLHGWQVQTTQPQSGLALTVFIKSLLGWSFGWSKQLKRITGRILSVAVAADLYKRAK